MKYINKIVFYMFLFFIITTSILFIKQSFFIRNAMNETLIFNMDDSFKNTIINSKSKINKYKLTNNNLVCLSSVEKYIDSVYRNNTLGKVTAKEFLEKYDFNMYIGQINEDCDFSQENRKKLLNFYLTNVLLTEKFISDKRISYELNFRFKDTAMRKINDVFFDTSSMEEFSRQTFELRLQDLDKNIILKIMEYLGEKYE